MKEISSFYIIFLFTSTADIHFVQKTRSKILTYLSLQSTNFNLLKLSKWRFLHINSTCFARYDELRVIWNALKTCFKTSNKWRFLAYQLSLSPSEVYASQFYRKLIPLNFSKVEETYYFSKFSISYMKISSSESARLPFLQTLRFLSDEVV